MKMANEEIGDPRHQYCPYISRDNEVLYPESRNQVNKCLPSYETAKEYEEGHRRQDKGGITFDLWPEVSRQEQRYQKIKNC